jgi:hypothetical protein
VWRQHRTGNPGTTLVDAVKFTVAEFALDIATGRDRQVHSAEGLVSGFIETGMIFKVHRLRPFLVITLTDRILEVRRCSMSFLKNCFFSRNSTWDF